MRGALTDTDGRTLESAVRDHMHGHVVQQRLRLKAAFQEPACVTLLAVLRQYVVATTNAQIWQHETRREKRRQNRP